MNRIRLAAMGLATVVWGAAQAAPAAPVGASTGAHTRVEVRAGNELITSVMVPPRARVLTQAERMTTVTESGVVVLHMQGKAQVEVREGDKLLFVLRAEQLVVRETQPGMASEAPGRSVTSGTFILG
jgi:hypothetical protein